MCAIYIREQNNGRSSVNIQKRNIRIIITRERKRGNVIGKKIR